MIKQHLTSSKPCGYIFTREISDFNQRTILLNNDVDGEVDVHRPRLVRDAQCNILLCAVHDCRQCERWPVPSTSSPFVYSKPLLFLPKETEFYVDVIEVPLQGASGASHNNCRSLQSDGHIFWNINSLIAEYGPHPCN